MAFSFTRSCRVIRKNAARSERAAEKARRRSAARAEERQALRRLLRDAEAWDDLAVVEPRLNDRRVS